MDAILIFNYQQFNKISVDLKFRKNHQSIFLRKYGFWKDRECISGYSYERGCVPPVSNAARISEEYENQKRHQD